MCKELNWHLCMKSTGLPLPKNTIKKWRFNIFLYKILRNICFSIKRQAITRTWLHFFLYIFPPSLWGLIMLCFLIPINKHTEKKFSPSAPNYLSSSADKSAIVTASCYSLSWDVKNETQLFKNWEWVDIFQLNVAMALHVS